MSDEVLHRQSEELVTLLSRLLRRLFVLAADDPAMEIPGAQMRLCTTLRDGPRTMGSLSNELGISQSAITQIADRLERAGMVERMQPADDRRCKRLALTAKGVGLMETRKERRVQQMLRALELLSPEQREQTVTMLNALLEASIQTSTRPVDNSLAPEHFVS